ncbi:hypothetical protein BGX34_007069 [Mortierella sp. NVP85]|nr:hypothetical protein BGX34_007069 [Mortierella sp. NVP85]
MSKVTPFDIPLLINAICRHLSCEDLKYCMLVSKAWSTWSASVLWRDLNCERKTPDIPTLRRHQEHIRIVQNITMWSIRDSGERLPFPHVQRLEFKDDSSEDGIHRTEIRVLPLLEGITSLQHLKITLSLDRDNIYRQFVRTLESLPQLESLSLRCQWFIDGKVIQDILRVCHRLECLSLVFLGKDRHITEEDRQEFIDTRVEIQKMPEMRLRELSFDAYSDLVVENILHPLLERCPRIEKLDPGSYTTSSNRHLSKLFKENKFPKLRHLVAGGRDIAEALSHVECGLESLVFRGNPSEPVIQTLSQYHSCMTKLHVTGVSLWEFSDLMAGLPNLQTFKSYMRPDYEGSSRDIPFEKHWECVNLMNLRLYVEGWGNGATIEHEQKGSRRMLALDYVFSEIAKMTSLQVLFLDYRIADLYFMENGYLTRLADLKQLRDFDLGSNLGGVIGKEEALWMIKNWPKLLRVYGPPTLVEFEMTLRRKRPQIQVLCRSAMRFPE